MNDSESASWVRVSADSMHELDTSRADAEAKELGESLLPPAPKRCWCVSPWMFLIVFALCSITNAIVAYGYSAMPLETAAALPALDTEQVVLLLSYVSIIPVVAIVPTMWLVATKNGLARSLFLGGLTLLVGAGCRWIPFVITFPDALALILIHFGSIVNCISTTVFLVIPSAFSAEYFPENQRTTATAVASTCFELGTAFVFVIPQMTSDVALFQSLTVLVSGFCLLTMILQIRATPTYGSLNSPVEKELIDAPALSLNPSFIGYEPVPVESSKDVIVKELKLAFKSWGFIAMALTTGIVMGVWEAWTPLIPEELVELDEGLLDDLALLASLGTIVGGFGIGPIADRCCAKQLKRLLVFCMAGMVVTFGIFTFIMRLPGEPLEGVDWVQSLQASHPVLLGCTFLTGCFQGGLVPLSYEGVAELSYPVSEGTSGGLLQIISNATSLILVFLFGAGLSEDWFNLSQWISMVLGLIAIALTKVTYARGVKIASSRGTARSSIFTHNPLNKPTRQNSVTWIHTRELPPVEASEPETGYKPIGDAAPTPSVSAVKYTSPKIATSSSTVKFNFTDTAPKLAPSGSGIKFAIADTAPKLAPSGSAIQFADTAPKITPSGSAIQFATGNTTPKATPNASAVKFAPTTNAASLPVDPAK